MIDWNAMQGVQTTIDKAKERRPFNDVNITQLSRGSWKANLSKGAVPNAPLGSKSRSTGQATAAQRKK